MLKEYVYEKIKESEKSKIDKNIVPSSVLENELLYSINKDVKHALNSLYKEKKIKIYRTINSIGIETY